MTALLAWFCSGTGLRVLAIAAVGAAVLIGLSMIKIAGRVECESNRAVRAAKQETRAALAAEGMAHDTTKRVETLASRTRALDRRAHEAEREIQRAEDLDAIAAGYVAHVGELRREAEAAHNSAVADFYASIGP
jgi:hypothetical protein